MSKKILSILLAVVMVFSIAPVAVFAEDDILSYLTYEINDGEVTITDCGDSISGDVVIPDTIEGYPVTSIGDCAFEWCTSLDSIVIPASVTTINEMSFNGCSMLKRVEFAENSNLTYIGKWAFANCVFDNIELPESVNVIDYNAFAYCFVLERITIPEGVERIEPSTFVGCMSLKEINFPDSMKHIDCAFDICPALESISIPKNVTTNEEYSFSSSGRLKEIYVYNPDFVFYGTDIGYVFWKFVGDYDEFAKHFNQFKEDYFNGTLDSEKYDSLISVDKNYVWLDEFEKIEGFVIHGYADSTAEAYANEHGFKFVAICDHENTEIINAKNADAENDGYTGDIYCNDCEEIISCGEIIPKTEVENSDIDNNTEENKASFLDKIMDLFNKIIEFIKKLFGIK